MAASESSFKRDKDGVIHADHPFFRYYGQLVHQQNMLQDEVRDSGFFKGMTTNRTDFKDKVVVDVGTGTGILAFFAVRAGARKVYAIEASEMARHARKLMEANGLSDKVEVIHGKVEDVELPEQADVIISEPMGFLLVHERMLESYMIARERFLRPGGKMFPSTGTMFFGPFTDQTLWDEQTSRCSFWDSRNFWGLDLSCLKEEARSDHFSQPVVGYFSPSILMSATTAQHTIDFGKDPPASLHRITIPLDFTISRTAVMHGIAAWFDVLFDGSDNKVVLSTGPYTPGTHWYQCRMLLKDPIAVNATQRITGEIEMVANEQYSYNIVMRLQLDGTHIATEGAINLQDQYYHYMNSEASATDASQTGPDPAAVYAASVAAAEAAAATSSTAAAAPDPHAASPPEIPEGFVEA